MIETDFFTQRFQVSDFDVDWNHRLTAGAFLRMAQQIATAHCDSLGMDDSFYQKNGAVFLMARVALQFYRVPKQGEILTLATMPETAHRALYKRITVARDEAGECVAVADSRWILVDTHTHRILRRPPEAFQSLPFDEQIPYELEMELSEPEELEACGSVRADYSRCDIYGHMNNTRYADAAVDALPIELLKTSCVKEMRIRYHNELPAGEQAQLERAQLERNVWYVKGNRPEKSCFEARITLE